jgi:NAD(P)-dependent dehydrogenase (short-subunit alcohol dehydrogenase family)
MTTVNVVMTGGTSGLGHPAAQRIAVAPDTRLILGARRRNTGPADSLPLDLASLASVRAFATAVQESLSGAATDILVLNAGAQFGNLCARSEDGFETTFAVNHLAHYLLLRLFLPHLAHGAAIIITTSDTHDPRTNPLAPRQLDPERLAHPNGTSGTGMRDGFRAYSASKLCNLLTARHVAQSAEAREGSWRVIAYNPGFTPGTSLVRWMPWWGRPLEVTALALRPVMRANTVEQAGQELADLALGRTVPPEGRLYASLVRRRLTWPDPAELAQRDDVMNDLWQRSARMVGLADQH